MFRRRTSHGILDTQTATELLDVLEAAHAGDFSARVTGRPSDAEGAELVRSVHRLLAKNEAFVSELVRLRRVIGEEGRMTERAVPDGTGGWEQGTRAVNGLVEDLVRPTAEVGRVITAVARGDLSQKITVDAKGEILELKNTINTMVDQLSSFADEVTRVAREVGTEGKLGGQARVKGVSGVWEGLTDNVNSMASNLTGQVRNIAQVTTAVAQGDLSQKITVDAKGEILELKNTINTMVDQLSSFADEVTRVAGEVGTEGELGGQARVKGVSGVWKDLTENVNQLAANLTSQVRNIAQVTTAVAQGDLSQKITVDAKGEILELKNTINTMVDQLSSFADEVTRVAREVGTEGELGGQARVQGVSGVWRDLTENVNQLAANLTSQVRNIAQVTTAVAQGDLSQKITVSVSGEILELKNTINTMVDQLSSFADEVTRVAREVGTEGKLGGQARVRGVSGIWEDLTDNVNQLAANLTTQVRAIAEVSTAVTRGDLTRSIDVEAQGEVAELKDNLNQMIANLRETTRKNAEQDWLKTNMARIGTMLQGQRDLLTVAELIMSELTPVVSAQHGAFFLAEPGPPGSSGERQLRMVASYGYVERRDVPTVFAVGEGLVGQAALEKNPILVADAPNDYIKITSGLGEAAPLNIIVLPILFEDDVLGVVELGALRPFTDVYQRFLEELVETIGVVLNTIRVNMRTEELLDQSRRLTGELQSQSQELQQQQTDLQLANEELQEKAELLAEQKRSVERKNREIEEARRSLQEKAEQLALTSKYKSEFLANMSHELRTPLNSMLVLAKLLAEDPEHELTEEQVEFAHAIESSGNDLLELINDILDLSKIEAGRMDVEFAPTAVADVAAYADQSFGVLAQQKGLSFETSIDPDVPRMILSDERRLQQVLKNLLANAVKFTEEGRVSLHVTMAADEPWLHQGGDGADGPVVAFSVTDTGIGVSEEQRQLIFEAFQQADGSTNRRFGGTGLGLSISRELARLLGGEIRVESEVGAGSTFSLYLPVDPQATSKALRDAGSAPSDLAASEAHRPPTAALNAPHRPVLLVVSDDAQVRSSTLRAAEASGWTHLEARDRDTALTVSGNSTPSAILLDAGISTASGPGLVVELQDHLGALPVHVVGDGELRRAALRAGGMAATPRDATEDQLAGALERLREVVEQEHRHVLLLGWPDSGAAPWLEDLSEDEVRTTVTETAQEAIGIYREEGADCIVVTLDDPAAAVPLLEHLHEQSATHVPIMFHVQDGQILTDLVSVDGLWVESWPSLRQLRSAVSRRLGLRIGTQADGDPLAGRKILLADDDLRNLFALRQALQRHGVKLVEAENGRRALEALEEHPDIDAVLMDIMMPELDGLETTRTIRRERSSEELPVIMLTAKALPEDRAHSMKAGASDFVTKPVSITALVAVLRAWLP